MSKPDYERAFYGLGAAIAKGACCDHLLDEGNDPNRCLREHALAKTERELKEARTSAEYWRDKNKARPRIGFSNPEYWVLPWETE